MRYVQIATVLAVAMLCAAAMVEDCKTCGGLGEITCPKCDGKRKFQAEARCDECKKDRIVKCYQCRATGLYMCPDCTGTGRKSANTQSRNTVECGKCFGSGKLKCGLCQEFTRCTKCNDVWEGRSACKKCAPDAKPPVEGAPIPNTRRYAHHIWCKKCDGSGVKTEWKKCDCTRGKITCPQCKGIKREDAPASQPADKR